jgi:hypothetical protein
MNKLLPFALACVLSACGADVASTAATEAELKAKEIEQAKQTQEQVMHKLDAADAAAQQRMQEADKATQ